MRIPTLLLALCLAADVVWAVDLDDADFGLRFTAAITRFSRYPDVAGMGGASAGSRWPAGRNSGPSVSRWPWQTLSIALSPRSWEPSGACMGPCSQRGHDDGQACGLRISDPATHRSASNGLPTGHFGHTSCLCVRQGCPKYSDAGDICAGTVFAQRPRKTHAAKK